MITLRIINTLLCCLLTHPALAQQADETFSFALESQPLLNALKAFSNITGTDYLAIAGQLEGLHAAPLQGEFSAAEALQQLLKNTPLYFEIGSSGSWLIKQKQAPLERDEPLPPAIDEVIVTAQKRHQTLFEVPISMSVLGGDALNAQAKTHTRELFTLSPSLAFHGAISSAGQALHIRGIGSGVIASGIEQSASTIVDGVVTGPSGSGLQDIWDVERIEVLRGPQGTLFGKNVSAGALHFISRPPQDFFESSLQYRYEFEQQGQRLDAMINTPLSNHWRTRLSGFYFDENKGDIENLFLQEDENQSRRHGLRSQWQYHTKERWLNLNMAYHEADDSCCARTFTHIEPSELSEFSNGYLTPSIAQYQIEPSNENRQTITQDALFEKSHTLHAVINSGIALASGHRLRSITGHRHWGHRSGRDADNLPAQVVWVNDERELEIFSQEFQWLSPSHYQWDSLIGLYYYHQRFASTEFIGGGQDVAADSGITTIDSDIHINNHAIFAHTRRSIFSHWTIAGGLRWLTERITGNGHQYGDNWIWPTNYAPNKVSARDNDAMGNITLSWQPTNDQHYFVSLARGYKGHAIDNTSNSIFYRAPLTNDEGEFITASESLLAPETVVSIEAGLKAHVYHRRIFISAVAFHSDFHNYQASAYNGNTNSFRLQNAGEVVTQGLELETAAELFGLSIDGSLTYTDARFKNFSNVPCQIGQISAGTCDSTIGQDISGQALNETPRWQFYLQLQKEIDTAAGTLTGLINYAWRDAVIFDQDQDPNTRQPAYSILGARMALSFAEHWQLSVYGNNLLDKDYAVRIIDSPIWRGSYQRYPGDSRQVGLEIAWRSEGF